MASNVEIVVQANVVDLQAKMAVARAEMAATNKELAGLAKQATQTGLTDTLKPQLLQAAEASVQAKANVASLASQIGEAGGKASEVRELAKAFRELASGDLSRLPVTAALLAHSFEGVSTSSLLGIAGLVGLAAGAAYLVYQEVEANKATANLAETFAATNRESMGTADAVNYQLSFLSKLPGSNSAAAKSFLELVAAHATWSPLLANEVGQLMPEFIRRYGTDAPQAASKLMQTLSELSVDGFRQLDRDLLNLSPEEYEQIENLIRIGDTARATSQILSDLAKNSGVYVKSLGDQVYDIEQEIKTSQDLIKNSNASVPGGADIIASQTARLSELQSKLEAVRKLESDQGQAQKNAQYKAELDSANDINASLNERATLLQKIHRLEQDEAVAGVRGDSAGQATFTSAIAAEKQKLAALDKKTTEDTYRTFVDAEDSKAAIYKSGSSERIRIAEEEVAKATALFGAQSNEYYQAVAKLNNERRAAANEAAKVDSQAQKDAADQALSTARNASQELLSNDKLNVAERAAIAKQLWDALISGDKLSADQRASLASTLANRIASEEGLAADDRRRIEQQVSSLLIESGKLTAQQRAQAVRDEADAESDARKRAQQETERIDKAKEQSAIQSAKDRFDLTSTYLDREVSYAQITEGEKLAALKSAATQEYEAEAAGVQKQVSALEAAGQTQTALYLELSNRLVALKQQQNLKLAQLDTQAAQHAVQSWRSILSPVESGFNSMFSSLLQHNQSFAQSTRQVLVQVVTEYAAARVKVEFDWLAGQLAMALGAQEWAGKSLIAWIATQLGITAGDETMKTTKVASDTAATAASIAASKAEAVGEIPAYTGIAAMGAASAVAPIPIIGPALAVAAAAEMNALGASELALASAEGGDEFVRGGLYQLHPREMVMPARVADPQREFFSDGRVRDFMAVGARRFDGTLGGGAAASQSPAQTVSGAAGQGGNTTIQLNALDTSDFNSFLKKPKNRRTAARMVRQRARFGKT